jgi:hypothetical protein
MAHTLTFLLASIVLIPASAHPAQIKQETPSESVQVVNVKAAQAKADGGRERLHWGDIKDAEVQCNAALTADPTNNTALDCLEQAARMTVDEQLNHADSLILDGKRAEAATVAENLINSPATPDQKKRAKKIFSKAQPSVFATVWTAFATVWSAIPDWIRQVLIALLFILLSTLVVRLLRRTWVSTRSKKRQKSTWNLLPLKELPGSTDGEKATDGLLDAIARLGDELNRDPWEPKLLLLRPTPPANYEPAVISDFLGDSSQRKVVMVPNMPELKTECQFHEVRLDEAVQNLQLKAGANIDVGSLVRFLMAMGKWIMAGTPTLSGSVEKGHMAVHVTTSSDAVTDLAAGESHTAADGADTISIHLAARGTGVHTISITTSSELQSGIDCVQLAAERAAFKFLVRMKYPQMTNDEVNGLAALRQGASIFSEFAGTIPDGGTAAMTRTSSLKSAASNLAFFRSSIPVYCGAPDTSQQNVPEAGTPSNDSVMSVKDEKRSSPVTGTKISGAPDISHQSVLKAGTSSNDLVTSAKDEERSSQIAGIKISDEMRQGVLLVEGVAHALTNEATPQNSAISCFRQLQEWPGSQRTQHLRQQGAYNEAIVRRSIGNYQQCVLMLTELLGDEIPGADGKAPATTPLNTLNNTLPPAIAYMARLARLAAFAQYTREDWTTLPVERATLLINDAVNLIRDLQVLSRTNLPLHDYKTVKYMLVEAMRATGHVELIRAILGAASRFYDPVTNRPSKLETDALDEKIPADKATIDNLERSIEWMRECEEMSPSCGLFCDISESYLLLKKFPGAQAYGRHATLGANRCASSIGDICARLGDDAQHERAFYLAAESYALAGNDSLAKKYASLFPGKVTLDEFKALRTTLGIAD